MWAPVTLKGKQKCIEFTSQQMSAKAVKIIQLVMKDSYQIGVYHQLKIKPGAPQEAYCSHCNKDTNRRRNLRTYTELKMEVPEYVEM